MRSYLTALLALALSAPAAAQRKDLRAGLTAGLHRATQKMEQKSPAASTGGRTLYGAGILAEIPMKQPFLLQPALRYVRKGGLYRPDRDPENDTEIHAGYLELSATLQYTFPLPFGRGYAGAGPVVSYLAGGYLEEGGVRQDLFSKAQNGAWRRADLGYLVTAGVRLGQRYSAALTYSSGLIDGYRPAGLSLRNREVGVSFGYTLPVLN